RSTNDGGASDLSNEASGVPLPPPPAAPTNLVANASSPTQIDLTWTDNSTNEFAFALWRKGGGADYQKIATLSPNTTSYSDTGLNTGTIYTYEVRAINGAGASDWSNEAAAKTGRAPRTAPTSL